MTKTRVSDIREGMDLTQGPIIKQLLRFVIPMLLANLLQQMYNAVDMIVIGHCTGSVGTVGVSAGGEVATMVTFLATAFGSAEQIYVAQMFGAREYRPICQSVGSCLVFMGVLSAVCAGCSIVFNEKFLTWLNCPLEAFSQAQAYMVTVSLGLPFVFGYNAICSVLRGMGETRRPLQFVALATVVNIVLDILLVMVIPLAAVGTAIATIAAQAASFTAAALFLHRKSEQFHLSFSLREMRLYKSHLWVLLRLGIPLAAQSALIHGTQIICASHVNAFGLVASAANSIGNKVHKLLNVFTISLNTGAGAMVGQNLGAGKLDRVNQTVLSTIALAVCFAVGASFIALFLPRQAFGLFTDDAAVMECGVVYLRIFVIAIVISALQGGFGAVVTGSGNTKLNFLGGVLDGVALRLGLSFVLAYECGMGVTGFFFGNALARLAPAAISTTYYLSGRWKTRKLLTSARVRQSET